MTKTHKTEFKIETSGWGTKQILFSHDFTIQKTLKNTIIGQNWLKRQDYDKLKHDEVNFIKRF